MYGIFTHIYHTNAKQLNIGIHTIHGFYEMTVWVQVTSLFVEDPPFKTMVLGTCLNSCRPTKTRAILRAHRVLSGFCWFYDFWMLYDVLKVCVPAVFGEGWRCCHQSLCGRLWNVYMFEGSRIQKSDNIGKMKSREEKNRREEEKELEETDTGARDFRQAVKHRVFTNDLWLGQKKGKGCQMQSLDLVPISFRSRSASRSDSFFS